MNKYLMLSAAAVLASSASAYAGSHTFVFGTASGGSYCDGGTVVTAIGGNKAVRAWKHTNNNCASGTSEGQGLVGKIKGLKKASDMSDTFEGKNYGVFSEQLSYTLPGAIKTGGTWTLWIGLNGTTSIEGTSGVLNQVNARSMGKGKTSSASVVKALIQQRLNQKS
jgi:hypothetical protein